MPKQMSDGTTRLTEPEIAATYSAIKRASQRFPDIEPHVIEGVIEITREVEAACSVFGGTERDSLVRELQRRAQHAAGNEANSDAKQTLQGMRFAYEEAAGLVEGIDEDD